jgi:hypothetical protein
MKIYIQALQAAAAAEHAAKLVYVSECVIVYIIAIFIASVPLELCV